MKKRKEKITHDTGWITFGVAAVRITSIINKDGKDSTLLLLKPGEKTNVKSCAIKSGVRFVAVTAE